MPKTSLQATLGSLTLGPMISHPIGPCMPVYVRSSYDLRESFHCQCGHALVLALV